MYIEFVLQRNDIVRFIGELAPVRIHMTEAERDRRWLELDKPTEVTLVPLRGVRIQTSGRLKYAVAGVKVPATIRSMTLMLVPELSLDDHERPALGFKLQIEDADLKFIPGLVDDRLIKLVNDSLNPDTTHMIWRFGALLTRALPITERLDPLDHLHLVADGADVHVDEDQLRLRVRCLAALSRSRKHPLKETEEPIPRLPTLP